MSRLVLHIGTHKTGTTAVQQVLAANRLLLAQHGIVYPDLGRGADHHGLVMPWIPGLNARYALDRPVPEVLSDLTAIYAATDATVVLSSEEFSRGSPANQVDYVALRDMLFGFDRIEVLCTLRSQPSFVQSIFMQLARSGNIRNWDIFLRGAINKGFASGLHLDFNALDDRLLAAFAPADITYVDYDAARAMPGGTPGMVLQFLDCPVPLDRLAMPLGGEVNLSNEPLTSWLAAHVEDVNRADAGTEGIVKCVLDAVFGPDCRTSLYTQKQHAGLLAKVRPWNAAFHDRLAARGSAVPALTLAPLSPDVVLRDSLTTEFWLKLAQAMHRSPPPAKALATPPVTSDA